MVLNMFARKDTSVSDDSKLFINSLPSTYVNLFRKRRQLLPVWSSYKYCVMIKSTFLVYYRVTKPDDVDVNNASTNNPHQTLKYLNLQNCTIKMIDDDTAGYVFCITPESGKGGSALLFAADTEKERATFAAQIGAIQRHALSVNDFETLKVLGKGHYGRVILAKGVADKQLYAVKEMKLNQVKAKVVYAERSVMEWAGADHPFVLGLDAAFARGKSVFLVSRFMPGGDLFLHMQNHGGCFSEDVVKFYGAELLLAIEHLHSMNIVHRDIKPENVLLDADGHVKLADMGLAKRLETRDARTKTMCGTDTYLPPEMVGRYPTGHGLAVDLWQLGCLLFELRAGYPPFYIPQSSQKSTHQRILYQSVRYPNNISRDFKSLLVALLEKKQEERLGFTDGVQELKQHAFFRGVDWDMVYKKHVPVPIVPKPAGDAFVNNFDPSFTAQPHAIYVSDDAASCYERDFAGFDYVRTPQSQSMDTTAVSLKALVTAGPSKSKSSIASANSSSTKVTEDDDDSDKPEIESICIKI